VFGFSSHNHLLINHHYHILITIQSIKIH
jgi:hypothetical protein